MSPVAQRPFSIHIFLPDGTPDGVRVIEKDNWLGVGLVCPRARFQDAKSRPEFNKPGVYVLLGPSDESDLPKVYIGQGDTALPRLEQHFSKKDFWTSLILFVSQTDFLDKTRIEYLESRLCVLAGEAKRCVLDNKQTPQPPTLSEAAQAAVNGFLEEMLPIYPLLGVTAFERPQVMRLEVTRYVLRARGIEARGYEEGSGFVVLAGSQVAGDFVPSAANYLQTLRAALQERGVIADRGDGLRLAQDYTFDSPSTAAGVVVGRTVNGREMWRDEAGSTLKENQSRGADDGAATE